MNKNTANIFFLIVVFFLIQWMFAKQGPQQPPLPPVQAPAVTTLPAGLTLDETESQEAFKTALTMLDTASKNAPDRQNEYYNKAIEALRPVVKKANESHDGLAAGIEIAEIQWHLQKGQEQQAATALSNIKLLHFPDSLAIPVLKDKVWTNTNARDYANALYAALTDEINKDNEGKFAYKFFDFFVTICSWAGSYKDALALIALGTLVTLLLTPVRNWQYKSMGKVAKLQPHMKRVQEQYKGQPEELNRKMMELYKEHGTNPLSGCLPMLVQIPFMWWLYYAIRTYQYQFNGSFLWVGSSFAIQHAGTWATPKGPIIAVSLGQMDIPLLILYAVSMFFSSKFMPMTSADPEQIKQSQRMSVTMSAMMPFMFYMYGWPSAFILWWLAMNVTQILVTVLYLRHHPDLQALYQHAHPAPAVPGAVPTIKAPPAGSTITKSGISPRSGGTSTAPNGDSSTSEEGASPSTNGAGPRRIEPRTRRKSRSRRF